VVAPSQAGGGEVAVDVNSSGAHSFNGVTTIIVQAESARKAQVASYTASLT
jgi:hypothetical protein